LLLADFLVVDTSKPFSDDSDLEIERAVPTGRPHITCGGRCPTTTSSTCSTPCWSVASTDHRPRGWHRRQTAGVHSR
jgi:hypothetical protein